MNRKNSHGRSAAGTSASTVFKRTLIGTACLLALGGANAQNGGAYSVTYATAAAGADPATSTTQTPYLGGYTLSLTEQQTDTGSLTGAITSSSSKVEVAGTGGSTPVTLTSFTAAASAAGNQSTTTGDLGLLANTSGKEGMAALTGQFISGTAAAGTRVESSVTDTQVGVIQSGMGPAAITVDGNTLTATTTLNSTNTVVAGATPSTYTGTQKGSIDLTQDAGGIASGTPTGTKVAGTTATVNLGTFQSNFNSAGVAGSNATVTNADVSMDLSGTTGAGNVLSAPLSLSSNTVGAAYTGNTSQSVYNAQSGSGAFTGSVAITNAQSNVERGLTLTGSPATASITGSTILADVTNGGADTTSVTGPLTVSSNTQSATSSGNVAGALSSSGQVLAGNALIVDSGAALTGTGSTTGTEVSGDYGRNSVNVGADLAVASSQLNTGTLLNSVLENGGALVTGDKVGATGQVTLSTNRFETSATGNLAGSTIYANTSSQSATAAVSNLQANEGTPITASTTGTVATVGMNTASSGTTTVSGNGITSTAQGNLGSSTVTLASTSLTALANNANVYDNGVSPYMSMEAGVRADAGVVASNLQSNSGGSGVDITASTTGAQVGANFMTTGASPAGVDLSAATVTVGGNTVGATAAGNTGTTAANLSGTSATLQAAVGNAQSNSIVTVSATTESATRLRAGAVSADSALTVDGNVTRSAASGNTGTNTLGASFTNLTLGESTVATSGVQASSSGASLALGSLQWNGASITSSTTASDGLEAGTVTTSALVVNGNRVTASSSGNDVTNRLAVDATNLASAGGTSAQIAGLGNDQLNNGATVSAITTSSTTLNSGAVSAGSMLTVNGNATASSASANAADNLLSASAVNLTVGNSGFVAADPSVSAWNSPASLALVNRQSNSSPITSSSTTTAGFGTQYTGSVAGSSLAVDGNSATASTSANRATNRLEVDATNLATAGGAAAQIAGLGNSQDNYVYGVQTATVGGGSAPAFGVQFTTSMSGSDVTVSGNTAKASALGNVAGNTLAVTGTNLSTTGGTADNSGTALANTGNYENTVTNEFGLVNRQTDSVSGGRTATASNIVVGVVSSGDVGTSGASATDGIATSNLAVTGNAITAEARNNSATNALSLTGFASLTTGAGLSNGQSSDTNVKAEVTGGSVTLGSSGVTSAGNSAFSSSNFSVTGNATSAMAIGSSASNTMNVQAVNITGNSSATGTGSSVSSTAAAAVADFGVANQQSQAGTTTSAVGASNTIDFATVTSSGTPSAPVSVAGAAVSGGTMTLDGNSIRSVAQALTASNTLNLVGTTVDANAAVANAQNTNGAVSATQTTTAADGLKASFGVNAVSTSGTAVSVSGNGILSSAGQNEAFNALNAYGTSVTGTQFAVLNNQAGTGTITTGAAPGLIGANLASMSGGSLTVAGNSVTSKANRNFVSNALTLDAQSALSGNGKVESTQSSSSGTIQATIGGSSEQITVGIAPPVPVDGSSISGATVGVTGNALNAQAGGNTAYNTLNANASASIGAGTTPTFAVLNTQGNSSALYSKVEYASVGAFAAGNPGGFTGSPVTVQGNQAIASTYANTASNMIAMSTLPGSANAASTSIVNSQSNTGLVDARVSSVNMGMTGAGGTGNGAITVSGNTISAAAVGNTAVNRVIGR